MARWYRPTSPLGRAVLPVVAGLVFFAVLALATWGIAALLARNPEQVSTRLATPTFEVGDTESIARIIAADGPLLFQGLVGDRGERSVVLDHIGDNVNEGWGVYYAHPADREATCLVEQVRGTRTFTDCEGRTLDVGRLAPPQGVFVVIGDKVTIDLRGALSAGSTTTAP